MGIHGGVITNGSIGDLALNRINKLEQNLMKMGLSKFVQSFIDEKFSDKVDLFIMLTKIYISQLMDNIEQSWQSLLMNPLC